MDVEASDELKEAAEVAANRSEDTHHTVARPVDVVDGAAVVPEQPAVLTGNADDRAGEVAAVRADEEVNPVDLNQLLGGGHRSLGRASIVVVDASDRERSPQLRYSHAPFGVCRLCPCLQATNRMAPLQTVHTGRRAVADATQRRRGTQMINVGSVGRRRFDLLGVALIDL